MFNSQECGRNIRTVQYGSPTTAGGGDQADNQGCVRNITAVHCSGPLQQLGEATNQGCKEVGFCTVLEQRLAAYFNEGTPHCT